MKITRVTATEVVVPAREGHVDRPAFGPSLFDKKSKWMVELETESGLIGYGETMRTATEADLRWAAQHMVGKSLFKLSWNRPVPPNLAPSDSYHPDPPVPYRFHETDFTFAGVEYTPYFKAGIAVEIAVQDLWAKALGVPLHQFFGGAWRDTVAVSWWFGRSDAEHAAWQTEIGLQQGFNAVKFKATAEDDIVGIVQAVKKVAGAATHITIDPNHRFYRLAEALEIAYRLEGFENIVFEDPFPFHVHDWHLFRQRSRIPLALTWIFGATENCCDYLNLEFPAWRFLGDAHLAWRLGKQCWHGSGVELGILDAYMIHCAAVARNCVLPSDAMGHRIRCDDLIEETLEVRDGGIRVPQGPGLGVTLDKRALEKWGKQRWEITV